MPSRSKCAKYLYLPNHIFDSLMKSDKIASLDISTNDFTSPSFYPHILSGFNSPPLVHGFISSNRVADLMSQFRSQIFQKIIPGLRKDGYTEEDSASSNATNTARVDPQPHSPLYDPSGSSARYPTHIPSGNPLEIGRRDLDPIPMNPFSPPSLFPRNSGDGMFVGPDHPIFGIGGGGYVQQGPWGGDGFLPPIGAPPGARFDPVGPRFGPFGGGRTGPFRGGDPDNDEFMPPGTVRDVC